MKNFFETWPYQILAVSFLFCVIYTSSVSGISIEVGGDRSIAVSLPQASVAVWDPSPHISNSQAWVNIGPTYHVEIWDNSLFGDRGLSTSYRGVFITAHLDYQETYRGDQVQSLLGDDAPRTKTVLDTLKASNHLNGLINFKSVNIDNRYDSVIPLRIHTFDNNIEGDWVTGTDPSQDGKWRWVREKGNIGSRQTNGNGDKDNPFQIFDIRSRDQDSREFDFQLKVGNKLGVYGGTYTNTLVLTVHVE